MKLSRYTFLFPLENGHHLAYNALTNGLAVVEGEAAAVLLNFSPQAFAQLPVELQQELRRGGFVVPQELREEEVVRLRYRAEQYASEAVGLTICPTLACNLACTYCFESCFRGFMDEPTQQAVAQFAQQLLPQRGGSLHVTWYGGEPLLALDVIENLTNKLQEACQSSQASYEASIITNGTLLTAEVAARLQALHITHAQVTLDGPPEVHDQRRPFRSGGPSFARILENLQQAVSILPIALRVNVDRSNGARALEFVRWLLQQSWFAPEKVSVHFGYVRKYTPSCGCSLEDMLQPAEFFALNEELSELLVEAGYAPPLPELAGGCTATQAKCFVIGPRGELYRCWNHVGEEKLVVGNVAAPLLPSPVFLRYMLAGFEEDEECLACKFLPICAGGCVDVRLKAQDGLLPGKDCSRFRYSLEQRLRAYYQWWWQQRAPSAS
jgi:uncharacterized protein